MKIVVNTISPKDNFISYNKFKLLDIPKISINKYFIESAENMYFLALSLFQLLTYSKINILPEYWSPSGPFSTFIPLMMCYLLELGSLCIVYIKDLYKTYLCNYCRYISVLRNCKIRKIKLKDISVGDLIIVNKDEIVQIDCILLSVDDGDYTNICLSNLNGECDVLCREPLENNNSYFERFDMNVTNIIEYPNSIKLFDADCSINNTHGKLTYTNFIPGGSINKGGTCVMIVVQIGTLIRSYTSNKSDKLYKPNFIDNYITNSLTNYFVPILAMYNILIIYNNPTIVCLFDIIKTFIQSWILLNGIVPFSIKIIVMLNRNIQSYLYTTDLVEYNAPNSLDNFHQIKHIICDKTGTITKNELLLTHISYNSIIYTNTCDDIPFNLISKVILGLHHKNKIYSTEEDKIISEKIVSLGTYMISNKNIVEIYNLENTITLTILEMDKLSFDCIRKRSSVIYKDNDDNYFIITKGALSAIGSILRIEDKSLFNKVNKKYNDTYPYLRTIAFCFKKIDYVPDKDPLRYETDGEYRFLTILGIQDELQSNILETVQQLQQSDKHISLCTGDRYETAIYIADTLDILNNTISINKPLYSSNITDKTFVFNSHDIKLALSSYKDMQMFRIFLLNSYNCIGYSLIPKDKQFITNIFEGNDIHIVSVGDGTNDIPMLKNATIGIGVKNGHNENVINNSQISISCFNDMLKINADSLFCFTHNYNSIYAIFYKTILIHSLIYSYILHNNYNLNDTLFNFFEIQGHHIIWGIIPILVANIKYKNTEYTSSNVIIISALFMGIVNSVIISIISNYISADTISIKSIILLLAIFSMNIQFLLIFSIHRNNIIACISSVLLGVFYIYYNLTISI